MERSQGKCKASKLVSQDLDFISSMPDLVVTNILDRLPIQYAMRTSALSKKWRFKWTMLSQLAFDENFCDCLCETKHEVNFERIISRILLNLKGTITKFVLYIHMDDLCYDNDVAHWLLFLSTKGVKDLTIFKWSGFKIQLSSHIFSCLELKHLELDNCCFKLPATFHGFPNLSSLRMGYVEFINGNFDDFISQCPLLESLKVGVIYDLKVQEVAIAKLTNLVVLTLLVRKLHNTCSRTIFELLDFLPKLQALKLDFADCKSFTDDGTRKMSSITFPRLKSLKLSCIDLENGIHLSFAFEIIRSSPNLQTLEIKTRAPNGVARPATCYSELGYNTIQLLKLQRVVLKELKGSNKEVCLIKFLLARCPFLEEIVIYPRWFLDPKENSLIARKMLKLHSTFPGVRIRLCEFE